MAYFEINQFNEALEIIDQQLHNTPDSDDSVKFLRAAIYVGLNKLGDARAIFEEILTRDPNNFLAITNSAIVQYRMNNFENALALQKKNTQLYPYLHSTWNAYANTLRAIGNYEEAINAVYKALEINPQDHLSIGTLAEIYASTGNMREFYKNLELSFSLGMDSSTFQQIMNIESIYKQFMTDQRFNEILSKYNIDIDPGL